MASSSTYPATLDGDLRALVPTVTPTEAMDFLQLIADAIATVQTELGTSPSGASATVAARFTAIISDIGSAQSDATQALSDAADAQSAADAAQSAADAAAAPTITANAQVDDYTLVLADAGKVIEMDKASAVTLTVPANADVAFPVGTVLEVCAMGAGTVTIDPAAGVTIRSAGSLYDIAGQYGTASLRKRATNEWVLAGLLA